MYCTQCQKEMVIMGMGPGVASVSEVEAMRRSVEAEGKLILFNPPPFGPRFCPDCQQELVEAQD